MAADRPRAALKDDVIPFYRLTSPLDLMKADHDRCNCGQQPSNQSTFLYCSSECASHSAGTLCDPSKSVRPGTKLFSLGRAVLKLVLADIDCFPHTLLSTL